MPNAAVVRTSVPEEVGGGRCLTWNASLEAWSEALETSLQWPDVDLPLVLRATRGAVMTQTPPRMPQIYSWRIDSKGSTRVARRTGASAAITPVIESKSTTAAKMVLSHGSTW